MRDGGDGVTAAPAPHTAHWGQHARIRTVPGRPQKAGHSERACADVGRHPSCAQVDKAKGDAQSAATEFITWALGIIGVPAFGTISYAKTFATWLANVLIKFGQWLLGKMTLAFSGAAAAQFLNSAWLTWAIANVLVAFFFWVQSRSEDSYWMRPDLVPSVLGWIRVGFITVGLVLTTAAIGLTLAFPEIAPLLWGAVAGLAVAYWQIAPRALDDLHAEQHDLGYSYTD
jgi:hypothetical protein